MIEYKNTNKEYVCYDEQNCTILNNVDEYFKNAAITQGAVEYHIPALINKDILKKCGYFSTFPQHLTLASYLKQNEQGVISANNIISDNQISNSNMYLTPAACLHIYPMLENCCIDSKIITTRAKVYRYENSEFNGCTRLWDFTVREIIFIGSKEYVMNMLEFMKQLTLEYTASLKLNIALKEAYDNFYPNKHNSIKMKIQMTNAMKYELVTNVNKKNLAISSFNYHGTHFSKTFNFDKKGNIVTGCVGYGLERWVSAINENNK